MDFEPLNEEIFQNLPEYLKNLTTPFMDRERDIILLSSLAVISNALPHVFGKYGGVEVSANLYVMILAPAASGKGVMNYSRSLIEDIDDHLVRKSQKAQKVWKEQKKDGKTDLGPFPPLELKIIPGNISSADLYEKIKNSNHGGIIIESEADTLNAIMKQDFGDFSDVLRKAFHHEALSISRKTEKQFDKINAPKLSILISGTPDQLDPFIKSTKNGLFSRMIYYYFNEIGEFKQVFSEQTEDPVQLFKTAGNSLFNLYGELTNRENPLQFKFTPEQIERFQSEMANIFELVCNDRDLDFLPTVKRHGLILFRMAMILTILRQRNTGLKGNIIYCEDIDFNTSLYLTKDLLYHADTIFTLKNEVSLPVNEQKVLDSLDRVFNTSEANLQGKLNNISERTMADKLKKWIRLKKVVKMYHGRYRKVIE